MKSSSERPPFILTVAYGSFIFLKNLLTSNKLVPPFLVKSEQVRVADRQTDSYLLCEIAAMYREKYDFIDTDSINVTKKYSNVD